MPTAIASAVAPQISQSHVQHELSPQSTAAAPPANLASSTDNPAPSAERRSSPPIVIDSTTAAQSSPDGKHSSPNAKSSGGLPPKIVVKKEPPSSPEVPASSRHRPQRLNLSSSTPSKASGGLPSKASGSLTARDSGSMGMQDVGLACLSPGFQTHDPAMQQQLQRSYSVRDQQRHIIESRLQKSAKATEQDPGRSDPHHSGSGLKTPMTSKKRSNPGLSIVPPSHEQFANERVIQSAPLHQTFTGRHQPHPLTRHVANNQAHHPESSHIHHMAAMQTNNRLPPITDVFANDGIGIARDGQPNGVRPAPYGGNPPANPPPPSHRPGIPSPGLQAPTSAAHPPPRPREYRSAEEAVADMTSGREDLLPKIVHYSGHQPPTPPSPSAQQQQQHAPGLTPYKHSTTHAEAPRSASGRRRMRAEYERDAGSPPLGSGPSPRRAPFGEGRDSPETTRRKKDEFLGLCARAWDLFHS